MVSTDTILMSLPKQFFKDALICYEQIKKIDKNKDPFQYFRFCTWGITSANICMESYLTQYIEFRCEKEGKKNPIIGTKINFHKKIEFLRTKLKSKIPSYRSGDFEKIRKTMDIRNNILLYQNDIFLDMTEQNTIDSIEACRDLVSFILKGDGKNPYKHASWVFQTKSKSIK